MRRTKLSCALLVLVFFVGSATTSAIVHAQKPTQAGPPVWVLEAWERGESPVVREFGPPAWVLQAWKNGGQPWRQSGIPGWVAARQARAAELGLPGPPAEVIEAWASGEGFDLPGPPSFVLDLLGL